MATFKSPEVVSKLSPQEIFNKISNLNNLKSILPNEIQNFSATENTCSFKIDKLPEMNLKIQNKTKYNKISLIAVDSKIPFCLNVIINEFDQKSNVLLEIEAEVNFMMKLMMEKPLTELLNTLSKKIKDL